MYCEHIWWATKKLGTHSHKILAIFCRLLIPNHVDSFLRPAHVSFGISNNMFYSLSILSCSLWRSVDCLLKNLWGIFAELILYGWENYAKRRKGENPVWFSFFLFPPYVWTKWRFHLICYWKRLNLCSFSLPVLLCVCEAVDLFLAEIFLLAKFINIPNAIVSCTILKKWTLSGWFLGKKVISFWTRNLLYFRQSV